MEKGKQVAGSTVRLASKATIFPVGAAGLDSWANVHLQYVDEDDAEWEEPLQLADGSSCRCRTRVGPKGIPEAILQRVPGRECINLLPQQWLVDRWCTVQSGYQAALTASRVQS